MIVVVDYGMGNIGSILNMLRWIGVDACCSSDRKQIQQADKLILPGVGAFDTGMQHLTDAGLIDVLEERVLERGVPLLGICLGMQLLTRGSQEGSRPGLGWVNAETIKFRPADHGVLKVPHMGWNSVAIQRDSPVVADLPEDPRFYFVHSYYVLCEDAADVVATTSYGTTFVSALARGHVYATQFHPEKSHKFGMKILENFSSL